MVLHGKSVLLGITGSVAAYKSVELIRRLRDDGASVRAIMTEASKRFITPLSIELASGSHVYCDMFESPLSHVALPAEADVFLIAPATANTLCKYARGIADNLLTTALLAFNGAAVVAPAMNWRMWENPLTQENFRSLAARGVKSVGPERGSLACGEEGVGRMADIEGIVESVRTALARQDLAGERVIVTAGPTREYLDPVRFISNRSSGKMGYALARVARRRGAQVTLISGPVSLDPPHDVCLVKVETAQEMHRAVMDALPSSTIVIMSAAVADFTPSGRHAEKVEKGDLLSLELTRTPDILREIGLLKGRPLTVGFSAETGQRVDRARRKLAEKDIDMIVFNDVTSEGSGFDVDTNRVVILDKGQDGAIHEFPLQLMSKEDVSGALFDRIIETRVRKQGDSR